MIIIKIKGGIGNQFFQYALGRKLALLNKTILKIDPDYDKTINDSFYGIHFRLDKFNIKIKVASEDEILKIKGLEKEYEINKKSMYSFGSFSKFYRIFYRRYRKLSYYKRCVVKEITPFNYDLNILKIKDNTYLDGYWPFNSYFKDIRNILIKDLQLKPEFETEEYKDLKTYIKSHKNSVSLHFRRGYARRECDLKLFGVLPVSYYDKAMRFISDRIEPSRFFVFSDDVEWAKKNFCKKKNVEFIDIEKDYCELKLMSYCKNNIIANSSFSWWSAWLNENPAKIVIAPERWYNNEFTQKQYEKGNFIPQNWIKL